MVHESKGHKIKAQRRTLIKNPHERKVYRKDSAKKV